MKANIETGEFKGHPTLNLSLESEAGFKTNIRYGLQKWKVILEHQDKIKAWIEEHEAKKAQEAKEIRDTVTEVFGSK